MSCYYWLDFLSCLWDFFELHLISRTLSDTFYNRLKTSFWPFWSWERLTSFLKRHYINFLSEWMVCGQHFCCLNHPNDVFVQFAVIPSTCSLGTARTKILVLARIWTWLLRFSNMPDAGLLCRSKTCRIAHLNFVCLTSCFSLFARNDELGCGQSGRSKDILLVPWLYG